MNERLSWMFPSVPIPRMFSTDVRVSWWFALVPLILCPRHGLDFGVTVAGLLFLSVLMHEFAHVFASRWTGGLAEEIHLTPFGGMAPARPARGAFGLGVTAAAGPLVNFFICCCVFPGWYARDTLWESLNPFYLPIENFGAENLWRDIGLLLFTVNWISLLVNLLPVQPLDGGQLARAWLSTWVHPELVQRKSLHFGLRVAIILLVFGACFDQSLMVLLGTFISTVNLAQLLHDEMGEALDDSGFGYDFSAGYESLEGANPTVTRQATPGLLQRWRERRRSRREQQERIRRMEAEQQLDSLLAKVHESGLQSLSEQEQSLLRSCSELLRDRQKGED